MKKITKKLTAVLFALVFTLLLFSCDQKDLGSDTSKTDETVKTTDNFIADTGTMSATDYPIVQLNQSSKIFNRDIWSGDFVITAPNYYGDAAVGETYTITDSVLGVPNIVGKYSVKNIGSGYPLFITQDGTIEIEFAFKKGDENTESVYKSAVFVTERDGNDVIFKPGTPVEHGYEFMQRVSGIFAVEVEGICTIEGKNSTMNDVIWGIVLSQKEVDEFFTTGQIANYSGFNFSGLNDIVSVK